jgi:predicted secreted protein
MNRGTILRTLSSETKFGAVHLKAQYYAMTGYLFPSGVRTPSLGAAVARTLGRRNPQVPAYIYIGRDIDTSDEEKLFISEYIGPGFYGVNYAPFMIPDPAKGLSTLNAVSGMKMDRLDRRQEYLRAITGLAEPELQQANKAKDYMKVMEDARAMMDSPVKRAFDFLKDEKPETVKAYEPEIGASDLLDKTYYYGNRFGQGLLLARRLVEAGARYIQVEYQYGPFKGFDMHESGRTRMIEMKRQVDRPIAQLIRDLDQRRLLDRTLVMISTEFGRTIASEPAAGKEPDGFAERNTGDNLVIENEKMYGFHGHFSTGNCLAFFGGGFKQGFVYGKTADRHPMLPVENPVRLEDVHATVYKALGIPADTNYVTEGRPFYVTKDGKGVPIDGLLA